MLQGIPTASYDDLTASTLCHCHILYRTPWPIKGVLRIQQYLQNKQYALWEVIEFGDSYKASLEETGKGPVSKSSAKKKGRTVVITTEDMQRRNDVKARTTLLLALPDEHKLRFSKYETAKELWEAILKTFGGNKATKKTKKNQLKQQYGNFKAEGSETLEQTFNRLDDLDTMSLDDVYNHLKVYEPEVQKKSESNSQNMVFISSSNTSSGKGEVHTASVPTASTQVSTASTDVVAASLSHDTVCSIMSKPMIKFVKEADCPRVIKTNKTENARKSTVKYAEMYRNISKGPNVRGNQRNWNNLKSQQLGKDFLMQNKACFKCGYFDHLAFDCGVWVKKWKTWPKNNFAHKSMTPRAVLLKPGTSPIVGNSHNNIDDKGYWDSGCSRHMTCNISYLSEYEPYDGGYVSFGHGGKDFKLKDDTNVLLRTPRQHNMHSIDLNNIVPHKNLTCLVAKALVDESMLWHRRLGHLNFKTMNKLVRNNLVKGLPSKCFENDHTCVACVKGKQHKASCKTKLMNFVSKPLHTLHMDLFGPTSVSSLNHKWYCLVVIDDFSRFTWTFFLKTKDETSSILRNFISEIENLKDLKVKIIRCDNGGEFKNKEMNELYTKKGIRREFSNVRTPQQNRVAERRNRTLIKAARTMLADAKLPVTFWAEAVNTTYHLGKFDAKGDEGYFIGYSLSSKAFKGIQEIRECSLEGIRRTVVVAGTSSTNISGTKDVASQAVKKDVSSLRYIALPNWFHEAHMETSNDTIRDSDAKDDSQKEQDCNADVPESNGISNPIATSKVPSADQVKHAVSLTVGYETLTVSSSVPTVHLDNFPESSSGPRLITKGDFSQKDTPSLGNSLTLSNMFEDTFGMEANLSNMETSIPASPTPTFRIHKDHPKIYQMDVKSAFLYDTIDEDVYVMQPPGFQDLEFPDRVYKVEKAIYGLHQAPRAWYGTLSKYLLDNDFQKGTINQTLFIRKHKGEFLLVQVYVDDIIFGSSNPQLCKEFEALMHDKFQMSAMDVRSANTSMDKENPWGKDGPDIMFAVCACARHQVTSKECHLHAIKRIFRYLKGHPKLGLWYPKESPFDLVAYSDNDYGGATQDRKSTTRCCQFLERRVVTKGIFSNGFHWDSVVNMCIIFLHGSDSEQRTHEFMHVYLVFASVYVWTGNFKMAKLAFCYYHNMVAILEKTEHNTDFHQIVDFLEASHIRYALTISPAVYVSHIRQFWSTARIETTNQEIKILATVDGKSRTISESSLRRHLKLNDEEGISVTPPFYSISAEGSFGVLRINTIT
uniref:Integrase catalytic domain-containing protein n=1 Tax=Tanacetum cinerariifolium TaxID=118510 RepID=A0A6L2LJZ3_TANCI|nr:hypothetical protein [Tanacetum cinerariifolium]